MKLKVNHYTYKNPILDNFTILNLSDVHGEIKYLDLVLNYLKNNKVDMILSPGDIIDRIDNDNHLFVEKFKELTKYAKTYVVLGNHDNLLTTDKMIPLEEIDNNINIKELKNTKDLYYSTSSYEKISINNIIDLTFIVLPNENYESHEKTNIAKDSLSTLEDKEVNKDKFNIMLLHSPRAILSKKKIIDNKLIDKIDLILSGHNHGGLTPTWIQDLFNNHIGFFGAYRTILEKHAYGIFKKK